MDSNFQIFNPSKNNSNDASAWSADTDRANGISTLGDAKSKTVNTGFYSNSLVVKALMDLLNNTNVPGTPYSIDTTFVNIQQAFIDWFATKINVSDIITSLGTSTTKVVAQSLLNSEISKLLDGTTIVNKATNAQNGVYNDDLSYQKLHKATNSDDAKLNLGTNIIEQKKLVWNTIVSTELASYNEFINVTLSSFNFESDNIYEIHGEAELAGVTNTFFAGRIKFGAFDQNETFVIAPELQSNVSIAPGYHTQHKMLSNISILNSGANGIVSLASIEQNIQSGAKVGNTPYSSGCILRISKIYKIVS